MENCLVCGEKLLYVEFGKELTCRQCGKKETGYVYCPNNHYICDHCHGEKSFQLILDLATSAKGINPLSIAEKILKEASLPMLGCEHAWIATGALLAAIKNEGTLKITNDQIVDALNRTRQQAIGAYCGLTGVCGIAPAIGACFSVILGAACPKDRETSTTMRVVSQIIQAIAEQTGPCCCKNFVRTALSASCRLAKQYLNINLPHLSEIVCLDSHRHPHGCRQIKCKYYPVKG